MSLARSLRIRKSVHWIVYLILPLEFLTGILNLTLSEMELTSKCLFTGLCWLFCPVVQSHACMLNCVRLFVNLWTVTCQAPLSIGFPRQEYWSGLPFPPPGDLSDPGIQPAPPESPACWAIGKTQLKVILW